MKASISCSAAGRLISYSQMENKTEVNVSILGCGDLPDLSDVDRIKVCMYEFCYAVNSTFWFVE